MIKRLDHHLARVQVRLYVILSSPQLEKGFPHLSKRQPENQEPPWLSDRLYNFLGADQKRRFPIASMTHICSPYKSKMSSKTLPSTVTP